MKCEHCGKEIKYVRDLSEEEVKDFIYLNNMEITANQALNIKDIDLSIFNENQVYEYFLAVYHQLAEARFLRELLLRNINKVDGISIDNIKILDEKIYIHEE